MMDFFNIHVKLFNALNGGQVIESKKIFVGVHLSKTLDIGVRTFLEVGVKETSMNGGIPR